MIQTTGKNYKIRGGAWIKGEGKRRRRRIRGKGAGASKEGEGEGEGEGGNRKVGGKKRKGWGLLK